jgi:hypothetical protein
MKLSTLPSELSKIGQITPWAVLKRQICYRNRGFATVTAGLLHYRWFCLIYLFISVESLKNHSKSQKKYKIENPILLDST